MVAELELSVVIVCQLCKSHIGLKTYPYEPQPSPVADRRGGSCEASPLRSGGD